MWIVAIIVAVLLIVALWVVIRGLIARDALTSAVPLVGQAKTAVLDGNTAAAQKAFGEVRSHADEAASLTSDPIWRAVEFVPWVGGNLRAFREAASTISDVADNALPPLGELASTFTLKSFTPHDGTFDLTPFSDAAPQLAQAQKALDAARTKAAAIDTGGTLPQIGEAVRQLKGLVDDASSSVDGLATAAKLLPPMLGADGPRDYLLLSLNNAELRTTGGIAGAMAVIHVDGGRLTLGATAAASDIGELPAPVLPLTAAEQTLYQDLPGIFIQDVNLTPDFARSGQLAQAMWKQKTGQTVDGVLAVDPVAISHILTAIGPVDAGSGITLTAGNAVDVLLSQVYAKFPLPAQQDAFFAGATKAIFQRALTGGASDTKLVSALSTSVGEQRIHIWSAHAGEQALIAGTTLATAEPQKQEDKTAMGVYFNDGTGAKMDYYLRAGIGIASTMCRADERPYFQARVSLTSKAPADAATSLPEYVTGGGDFGVPPGTIQTNVFVHAPKGTLVYGVQVDGREVGFLAATDSHSIAAVTVQTTPGQTTQITFEMLGTKKAPTAVTLQHTPMVSSVATSIDHSMDCPQLPGHVTGPNAAGIPGSQPKALPSINTRNLRESRAIG